MDYDNIFFNVKSGIIKFCNKLNHVLSGSLWGIFRTTHMDKSWFTAFKILYHLFLRKSYSICLIWHYHVICFLPWQATAVWASPLRVPARQTLSAWIMRMGHVVSHTNPRSPETTSSTSSSPTNTYQVKILSIRFSLVNINQFEIINIKFSIWIKKVYKII